MRKRIKRKKKLDFEPKTPTINDKLLKAKRGPQVILPKDVGIIIGYTGIKPGDKVVDAGSGSGFLSAHLANIGAKVVTYEKRKEFFDIAKANFKRLGLNVKIKNKDISEKITEKNLNLITLDLPEPWTVIEHAEKALQVGGYLVAYLPNMTQVIKFCHKLEESEVIRKEKAIECIEREWRVDAKIARPEYNQIVHTGFLIFARKISK